MKRHILSTAACAALLGATLGFAQGNEDLYTQVNIWVEHPKPIPSTNYHQGEILPIGSKVQIVSSTAKEIQFTCNGRTFTLQFIATFSPVGIEAVKARTFGKTNPLETDAFKSLSDAHKTAVKSGTIVTGMPKAAVLMAYGYPPEHKTATTESNYWLYWRNRNGKAGVTFVDGKVTEIKGAL